jgi:hypothetical protein
VEVRIAVQNTTREIIIESAETPDSVAKAVTKALATTDGVLTLTDEHGKQVIVPAAKLAFVEIGEPEVRRVGFGAT